MEAKAVSWITCPFEQGWSLNQKYDQEDYEPRFSWRHGYIDPHLKQFYTGSSHLPEKPFTLWDFFERYTQKRRYEYRLEEARFRIIQHLLVPRQEAIGFVSPRKPDDRPVLIPYEAWEKCHFDWNTYTLKGAGFEFSQIVMIFEETSPLLEGQLYDRSPAPLLAKFAPSEERRLELGIPADEEPSFAQQEQPESSKNKGGRSSKKREIASAFHQIEKDPNWSKKQLYRAVLTKVQANLGIRDEKGLSYDTIIRHTKQLWQEFSTSKPS